MWTNDKSCAVCIEDVVYMNLSIVLSIGNYLNDKCLRDTRKV